MPKRGDLNVDRLVVSFMRAFGDVTQMELARASRVSQSAISEYEAGNKVPTESTLKRLAEAVRLPWPVVLHLRRFYAVVLAAAQQHEAVNAASPPIDAAILECVLLALSPHLIEKPPLPPDSGTPQEERRKALEIWTALEGVPPERRRRLIELSPWVSWALAERVCQESVKMAAQSPEGAQELATLAVLMAEKVPGLEGKRSRLLGFCWAHVANARRVANDFAGADEAFNHAWRLWRAGSADEPGLLPEWRLLDLEASLRREQRRFREALDLLDQARAAAEGDSVALARILLNREHTYDEMGDRQGSLAVLEEAAPFAEEAAEPRLLFALRFKTAGNLYHLGRFNEAATLLPEVKAMALRQGNGLDLIRVVWLEARLAAGQGRKADAIKGLEQVQREFSARKLPYDAARSSLELAELWLEAGRTQEVRELASAMAWIFQAKGIGREALAALRLFTDAARREAATVELARRAISDMQAARRSAI